MKRNNFFKAALSTFGLMSLSKDLFGKTARTSREKNGFKVDSGKDRTNSTISLFEGDTFDAKVSTMDTDGRHLCIRVKTY